MAYGRPPDHIPREIILCDWHYDKLDQYPSVRHLLNKGFTVWPSSWNMPEAALDLLEQSYRQAKELNAEERMPGMLVSGWNATGKTLAAALLGEGDLGEDKGNIKGIAETLRAVMDRLEIAK